MVAYHDQEWGVPQHDDRVLFEFLILEGAQAGLSWETILKKRSAYRLAFDDFDPVRIAHYGGQEVSRLLANPSIVRNRLKICSAVLNAQAFLNVQREFGRFNTYLSNIFKDPPCDDLRATAGRVTRTAASDRLSEDLRKRGFKFVGTTICYAFMQAVGMVNDHERSCFRRAEVAALR